MGLVNYQVNHHPFTLIGLYILFICYYGDVFNFLSTKNKWIHVLLGLILAPFAYRTGMSIAHYEVIGPIYYLYISLCWALFFPLTFKLFYSMDLINKILDATILLNFDKTGFYRHQKNYFQKIEFEKKQNILITGGTSGIGEACAQQLSHYKHNLTICGRSEQKGKNAAVKLKQTKFKKLDLLAWDSFPSFCDEIDVLDSIILNAGAMPQNFKTNSYGVEVQIASQLMGHYFLIRTLKDKNKLARNAKIIWMSSGGMYLKKLEIDHLYTNNQYDKVHTYANVKRAQVELLEKISKEFSDYLLIGMHPGWVATPGLTEALPKFSKIIGKRLREPYQGADTAVWLCSQTKLKSAGFYFDRKLASKHFLNLYQSDQEKVDKLYNLLQEEFSKLN